MGRGPPRFEDIPPIPSDAQDPMVVNEPKQLRVAQCNRVWGSRGKIGGLLGAKRFNALQSWPRSPRGDLPNRHL